MNRVLCQTAFAALLLAGCQSPFFRSADKRSIPSSSIADKKENSNKSWMDFSSDRDRNPGLTADRRDGRRGAAARTEVDLSAAHQALNAGKQEKAKALYLRVLSDDPQNPSAHHRLATIADRQRDFRTANRHYSAALRQRPKDSELVSDIGWSYFLQQRYDESERNLKRAIELDRKNSKALANLGWLYGIQGRPDLAYHLFRQAGSRDEADRMMKQLQETEGSGRGRMLADSSANRRRKPDLRAPDPGTLRRNATAGDSDPRTDDINVRLRRQMDLERDRELAAQNRNGIGSRSAANDPREWDDRLPRGARRADDPRTAGSHGRAPYSSGYSSGSRIAVGGVPDRHLNEEMRRLDDNRRPPYSVDRSGTRDPGVRSAGYDDRPAYDPRDSRPGGDRRGGASRQFTDNPYPPADPDPYRSQGDVRNAISQRVIANGVDRRQPARSSEAVDREALRLGHNAGAGGNPFAIPNGSRDARTPPTRRIASSPTAPEQWRGNDRSQGSSDGYFPRELPGNGAGDMTREFDGPDIRPRTKGNNQ